MEQFANILENTRLKAPLVHFIEGRLERLRVRMQACTNKKRSLPITLSIGVAVASHKSTMDSLFKLADCNLYKVKKDGRNGFLITEDK